MKKKKRLADLMEEDLMETTQKRIDELNAELKMLDEQCGKFFTPYPITASRLSCLVLSINLIHCGNEFRNSVPVRTLGL